MVIAPPHRFTIAEYHQLAELGVLQEDARVELLNGVIVDMMPIGPFHGGAVTYLSACLNLAAHGRWITTTQNPIQVAPRSEPQPDLALLKPRADYYRSQHPGPEDAFLVIEVSDSSLLTDREEKLPIYARGGIPECWIVNLPERKVEIYAGIVAGEYTLKRIVRPGDPLAPEAFPDAGIDSAELLRSPVARV